jgi:uncharacterized protein (TIGR03083 family)
VAPLAAEFRENRVAVIEFAHSLPAEAWDRASPLEGWTYRDVLAHLAAGTDKQIPRLLRAVITRTRVDPAWFGDSEQQNARNLEERRGWAIDELVAELESDGEEILDLLAQLTDVHAGLRQKDFPQTFGESLPLFAAHDREHLKQLRTALTRVDQGR